jgi:hypothetical protein
MQTKNKSIYELKAEHTALISLLKRYNDARIDFIDHKNITSLIDEAIDVIVKKIGAIETTLKG